MRLQFVLVLKNHFKEKKIPVLDQEVHQVQRGLVSSPDRVVQCCFPGFLQGAIKHSRRTVRPSWAASILPSKRLFRQLKQPQSTKWFTLKHVSRHGAEISLITAAVWPLGASGGSLLPRLLGRATVRWDVCCVMHRQQRIR